MKCPHCQGELSAESLVMVVPEGADDIDEKLMGVRVIVDEDMPLDMFKLVTAHGQLVAWAGDEVEHDEWGHADG